MSELDDLVQEWAALGPLWWAESDYGWLLPDRTPIRLTPWQRAVLAEYWQRRDLVSTLFVSTVKKAGKTLLNSALTTWRWLTLPGVHFVIGNDQGQSEELQINVIATMVRHHPILRRRVKVGKTELTFEPTGSRIVSLPMDYAGAAGSNFATASFTELWAFAYEYAVRLYEELTPIPLADCLRIVDSYSGFEGEGETLKSIWERGLEGARINDAWPIYQTGQQLSYVHTGEDAQRRCWRGTEAARAVYYAEQEATLRPETYRRLHLNEWTGAEGEFIPIELWDACRDPDLPPLRPGDRTPLVLSVDAAVSGDTMALAVTSRHPTRPDVVAIRAVQVWTPPRGGKLDYGATLLPALVRWCTDYNVAQASYDPFQLHYLVTEFRKRGLTWCMSFDQGTKRLLADSTLYHRIIARTLAHDGDPVLRQHVLNAAAKVTADDSKLRIVKRGRGPVDALVAVSQAAAECGRLALDGPAVSTPVVERFIT